MQIKKFSVLILLAGLMVTSTAAAAGLMQMPTGSYRVNINLNIRAAAGIKGKLIDHLNKGDIVNVTEQKGLWCKISWKNYSKAYVKCSYLGQAVQNNSNSTGEEAVAISDLAMVKDWLVNKNQEGKNYINDSLDKGIALSKIWASDAYLVKGEGEFNSNSNSSYCSFTFASAQKANEKFVANCKDMESGLVFGAISNDNSKMMAIVNPELKLTGFVSQFLDNAEALKQLNSIFVSERLTHAKINFLLDANNKGPMWKMTINAGKAKVNVSAPANNAKAVFSFN